MKPISPKTAIKAAETSVAARKRSFPLQGGYKDRRRCFRAIELQYVTFSSMLKIAFLRHRYGLGDANAAVADAIDFAEAAAKIWLVGHQLPDEEIPEIKHTYCGISWENVPNRVEVIGFRFSVAALLGLLIDQKTCHSLLRVMPEINKWESDYEFYLANYHYAAVYELVERQKKPAYWTSMISFLGYMYNDSLLSDTLECYADIVTNCSKGKWDAAQTAVCNAIALYEHRGNAEVEEFEVWEGGGVPVLSIDLRLSVIMRHCFWSHRDLIDSLNTFHQWPWD